MDKNARRMFRALAELEEKLLRQYEPLPDPTDQVFHRRHKEKTRKQIVRLAESLPEPQKQIVLLLLQLHD